MAVQSNNNLNIQVTCNKCHRLLEYTAGEDSIVICPNCQHKNRVYIQVMAQKGDTVISGSNVELDAGGVDPVNNILNSLQYDTSLETTGCQICHSLSVSVSDEARKFKHCSFCGRPNTTSFNDTHKLTRPDAILPFSIQREEAFKSYKKWLDDLWFAPDELKNKAKDVNSLAGVYIPFWFITAVATGHYTGERGEDYDEEETRTEEVDGKEVTRTETVTHTSWYSTSGTVTGRVDNHVMAVSHVLPEDYLERLEPWDLENLVTYDTTYIHGYMAEIYQLDASEGFDEVNEMMMENLEYLAEKDIGGDDQRVNHIDATYTAYSHNHVLLPVWLSSYQHNGKIYRIMVNARTGEVQGERPYSWGKLVGLIGSVVLVALAYYFYMDLTR